MPILTQLRASGKSSIEDSNMHEYRESLNTPFTAPVS